MILLSVDTSGTKGSLALARIEDNSVKSLDQVEWTKKAMHSEIATVELGQLLRKTKVELRDLNRLAVNIGPGSFTGLRVGISLVKTLSYSLGIPVHQINSLESLAFSQTKSDEKIFVAIKAVQNFFYAASFERKGGVMQTRLSPCSLEDHELNFASDGCTKVLIEGQTAGFAPASEARHLVELLVASGFSQTFSDWKLVEPLYIRASEAEEKLKKGLLKPV